MAHTFARLAFRPTASRVSSTIATTSASMGATSESTWLFRTCMFSTYFSEQMPAIYREINQRYAVAGFFTNGWPSTGALTVCYCENCQRIFREQVGGVPPEQTDATSPLYRKYYDTYMDRVLETWRQWQSVV